MSAVLELNDQALSLYIDGQLRASSPGYVLAVGKQPQFGVEAAAQSRLHPLNTNNEFWQRLSMDPLPRPLAHFRHYADIAHAHLQHLGEIGDYRGPVALAVPGSFSRDQLAVLSGIIRQSPFTVRAMVDSGVIAAAAMLPPGALVIHLDLQLHQTVLTRMSAEAGRLRREQVVIVQGVGWDTLSNTMVQVVNDAFIEQSRFNPQHSARWEQQLYNELPQWLAAIRAGAREIQVHIETDQARHQATVLTDDLIADLEPALQKIELQLSQLAQHQSAAIPVLISSTAALLPGLRRQIHSVHGEVAGEQMSLTCARMIAEVPEGKAAVPYITSVRIDQSAAAAATLPREAPTHVLVDGLAWPLSAQQYLSAAEVDRVRREHAPGDVLEHRGKRLQLIKVQHGLS
jgi:hypothetical protein